MARLRLRTDVLIEPVVNDWYAWAYLVNPVTLAMITVGLQYPIVESFLKNPKYHAEAQLRMRGGPYLAYGPDRLEQVRALFERMKARTTALTELHAAIRELTNLINTKALGESLEALYQEVPQVLKGCVELFYDEQHRPGFRFFETAMYKSRMYDEGLQGYVLGVATTDDRPFALSTPRLAESPEAFKLTTPFASDVIDRLSRARHVAQDLDEIAEMLPVAMRDKFFERCIDEAPAPARVGAPDRAANGVEVTYLNHAALLIQSHLCVILTDPLLAHTGGTSQRLSYGDLPEHIDFVVLTHNHQDHVVLETLLQLRHRIGQVIVPRGRMGSIIDPNLKLILQRCGFRNVLELNEFEEVAIPGGRIRGIPFLGEHGDLAIDTKLAYVIELNGKKVFIGADLNNLQPEIFESVYRESGAMDAVFIGMECDGAPMSWLYGPLLLKPLSRRADQTRRLNGSDCNKAMALIATLAAKRVYVYAMGAEPWLKFISSIEYTQQSRPITESDRLVAECEAKGIPCERLYMGKILDI